MVYWSFWKRRAQEASLKHLVWYCHLLHWSQSCFYTVSTGICLLMHSVEKAILLIIIHLLLDVFLMHSLSDSSPWNILWALRNSALDRITKHPGSSGQWEQHPKESSGETAGLLKASLSARSLPPCPGWYHDPSCSATLWWQPNQRLKAAGAKEQEQRSQTCAKICMRSETCPRLFFPCYHNIPIWSL